MSSISTILITDVVNDAGLTKTNDNFSTLNTDKMEKSGGTFTGDISVPDEAYGAGWNASLEVPTKNAIYDKIEALPVLTDGDKGDLTLSSSGTVWTIDNDVVTNAKMANMATATFKGRTTAGTGDPEDLTATQATALLNVATTSLKGLLSASDKTKLDGLSQEWTLDKTGSFTAGGTYDSGTLTTYDEYKIEIQSTTTTSGGNLTMRHNSNTSAQYSRMIQNTSSTITQSTGQTEITLFTSTGGSGYVYNAVLYLARTTGVMKGDAQVIFDASFNSSYMINAYRGLSVTSIQLNTCTAIAGNIKIYGRNY